jgi:hypothetical protein
MPIAWRVDSTERRAWLTVSDPYAIDEWRAAVTALLEEGRMASGFALIVDRRGSAPPTTHFVNEMAAFFAARSRQLSGVRAAVVVDSETGFGMSRMTGLKSELDTPGLAIRPFRSYEEAERWLTVR